MFWCKLKVPGNFQRDSRQREKRNDINNTEKYTKKKQYWEIYINITEKYTKKQYWEIYIDNTEKYTKQYWEIYMIKNLKPINM